jgi:NAD(P)H-dependent FMN reductase
MSAAECALAETGPQGPDAIRLQVVIASTRPGRAGKRIADWFIELARQDERFDIHVTDLAELALPMMNEPHHPRLRQYVHEHTWEWSRTAEAADAFVLVMPEYNHAFPASIKNAIDYLHDEWAHKPVGFVSYGGVSAGMRSVQMLKPVLSALKMIPLTEQVALANFFPFLSADGFAPGDLAAEAATAMLNELSRTTAAMHSLRSFA